MKKTLCAGLLMAVMPGLALAQVARTGSMQGTVKDPDALTIPGVTVTVNSDALIRTDVTTTTDQKGFYRFLSLPPGLYSVRFEIDGFQSLVREEIRVSLSAATNLTATLTIGGLEEEITVVGESPTIDTKEAAITTNLSADFVRDIPVTRQVVDFIDMTPGYHTETAHGSSEQENSINLDGMEASDPWSGGISSNFSIDIVAAEASASTSRTRTSSRTTPGARPSRGRRSGSITSTAGRRSSAAPSFETSSGSSGPSSTSTAPTSKRASPTTARPR